MITKTNSGYMCIRNIACPDGVRRRMTVLKTDEKGVHRGFVQVVSDCRLYSVSGGTRRVFRTVRFVPNPHGKNASLVGG